jgi:hypothetical protein
MFSGAHFGSLIKFFLYNVSRLTELDVLITGTHNLKIWLQHCRIDVGARYGPAPPAGEEPKEIWSALSGVGGETRRDRYSGRSVVFAKEGRHRGLYNGG